MDGFLRSTCTSTEQEYILLQSNVGVNDNRVQPEVGMDDNNDATTQQAAVREEFASLRRSDRGRQLGLPSRTSNMIGASFCDTVTFLKRETLACVLPCLLFFPLVYFVCAVYRIFPVLSTKIAEAGTKGEMSYLGAPDAWTAVPRDERSPSRVFADEGRFLCTSLYSLIAFEIISLSWQLS